MTERNFFRGFHPTGSWRARYSSNSKDVARRDALRGGNGECADLMNATAVVAPAGPQYMRALERANQVRLARAELKREIATGEIGVADVILECPWEADSMAVADLLMSQRRWGQSRCRKFLGQIQMSEKKTVGSMTERQRVTLAAMLTSRRVAPERDPWLTDSRTTA